MKVLIVAYCAAYGNMYGMTEYAIEDVNSFEEADEIGTEMSYEIMNDYSIIQDYFDNQAVDVGCEEGSTEYYDYIAECQAENVAYKISVITADTNKSNEQLSAEYSHDPDLFMREYCE